MEFIFLGTGTSSCLPNVHCLTKPPEDGSPCRTCLSTLTPEGKKNIRRNTSGVIRMDAKDGRKVTIVIDAGKTFQAAAVEWFPKYGLRRIDALLITHAHADAMNGLDDLRGWTLGKNIQSHIDVYLSAETFREVQRSFPYLVAKEFASGGGDVPEFVWHIIEDKVPFEIDDTGIRITPFLVHHGRLFTTVPHAACVPTPTTDPTQVLPTQLADLALHGESKKVETVIQPYLCFGFKIEQEIVYLSDVSYIPKEAWAIINEGRGDHSPLPVCVLDCLGLREHTSHFGFKQAVQTAREIGAQRTYLTGFAHKVSHEEYVTITKAVGDASAKARDEEATAELTETEKEGLDIIEEGKQVWVRPAHDGLRVFIDGEGRVRDETYGNA
ncbi:hypothetical protein K435DRAFT_761824 [Dendrothele bispora CBS 962.96]|uniref:Metallo-beta-lactamase domain-containing protein n=1 Tax=Dendrothele bispora (strain CBS 962.96) TaxID=1314807 RepID=A0A4S8LHA2_DENBC|nr:hypothetical protein K435DRAFT_761824 [Dendrothele bispora CBS 962.96]